MKNFLLLCFSILLCCSLFSQESKQAQLNTTKWSYGISLSNSFRIINYTTEIGVGSEFNVSYSFNKRIISSVNIAGNYMSEVFGSDSEKIIFAFSGSLDFKACKYFALHGRLGYGLNGDSNDENRHPEIVYGAGLNFYIAPNSQSAAKNIFILVFRETNNVYHSKSSKGTHVYNNRVYSSNRTIVGQIGIRFQFTRKR